MGAVPEHSEVIRCKNTAAFLHFKFSKVKDGTYIADPINTNIWKLFPSKKEVWLVEGYRCPATEFIFDQFVFLGWRVVDKI